MHENMKTQCRIQLAASEPVAYRLVLNVSLLVDLFRDVVSVSTSRSRDGLETHFPNVSVSSRSWASESRLQVTFFSYKAN